MRRLLPVLAATTATHAEPVCAAPYDPAERITRHGAPGAHVPVPDLVRAAGAAPVAPALRGSIRRVEVADGRKLVALTFDLCETAGEIAGYDGGVIDTLRRLNVRATLFAGGHWVATHRTRFSELAADSRFEIANHSWSHANLRRLASDALRREVLAPQAQIMAANAAPMCQANPVTTAAPTLFRFPFGACDDASMKAVNDAGMAAIQWDVSTGDPSPGQSARGIVATTLAQVRPGSIVLAHANGRGWHTVEALPQLIQSLRAQGYSFVTVTELLASGRPVITPTCYDSHPGDTNRYDRWPLASVQAAGAQTAQLSGRKRGVGAGAVPVSP